MEMVIKMKKGDYIILVILFAIATGLAYQVTINKDKLYTTAIVVSNDEKVSEFKIDVNYEKIYEIEKNGHLNTIEIKDGKIRMLEADCPDQLCVKSKAIDKNGEMIVCLPNKMYVKIKGSDNIADGEEDIIAS